MARAVIDEMTRWGVDFVAISPGSRSAALAIAAAEHPAVTERVILDERSAAFHALGRAKASGRPAAVISTSPPSRKRKSLFACSRSFPAVSRKMADICSYPCFFALEAQ
jgi:hypothetical protein